MPVNVETKLIGNISTDLDKFESRVKESVIRSGAAEMARVLYEQAKENAPTLGKEHWFYGTHKKYLLPVDALKNAIYRVYSQERSSEFVKTYRISWNHKKAPHGFMVEYGTSHSTANGFMRRAFDRIEDAITAGNKRMEARLSEGGHIPVAEISDK